jgi:N-acetylneuraminic acid mutarotase
MVVDTVGRIIVFGGTTANGKLSNEVWRFDPATEQWTLIHTKGTCNLEQHNLKKAVG